VVQFDTLLLLSVSLFAHVFDKPSENTLTHTQTYIHIFYFHNCIDNQLPKLYYFMILSRKFSTYVTLVWKK